MARYTAPASANKPRIPHGKPHRGPLSAHTKGAAPPTQHKPGGYRMSGDGKKLPMNCS